MCVCVCVRLPSMKQFSIIDKNKGMCYIETQNKYRFKYFTLFFLYSETKFREWNSSIPVKKNILLT